MGRLDGKVALISGAARGQGEAEARLFAAEGAKVVLADILDEEGTTVAKDIGDAAAYLHLDVTSEADWQAVVDKAIDRFGGIDVLVNNAGIFAINPLATTSLDEYRRIIEINQVGVFLGMKAVASHMAARASGSIINISSVAGLQGSMGTISYTASKFAVRGMTKVVAKELAPFGVRVNSVHPGPHRHRDAAADLRRRAGRRRPAARGRPARHAGRGEGRGQPRALPRLRRQQLLHRRRVRRRWRHDEHALERDLGPLGGVTVDRDPVHDVALHEVLEHPRTGGGRRCGTSSSTGR